MYIPVLEEIDIPNLTWGHAKITLDNLNWGDHPYLLKMKHTNNVEDLELFLDKLYDYLTEKGLSPKFPYPVFIKTHLKISSEYFMIVGPNYSNQYYLQKSHSIKSKESSILKKISILKDSFLNHDFDQVEFAIHEHSQRSKRLKTLCHEKFYYNSIIDSWSNHE